MKKAQIKLKPIKVIISQPGMLKMTYLDEEENLAIRYITFGKKRKWKVGWK